MQVVAMTQSRDKIVNDSSKTVSSCKEDSKTQQIVSSGLEASPLLLQESTNTATSPATKEGELVDALDKRIKKPPPYHIAAVMSRHAADFNESSVEVSLATGGAQGSAGLTVKELPGTQQVQKLMSLELVSNIARCELKEYSHTLLNVRDNALISVYVRCAPVHIYK